MGKKASWYGVRTLYRLEPVGPPQGKDGRYSAQVTGIEERIVVLRARSGTDAIRKGKTEAKAYAASSFRNPYGQRVRTRYLGHIDIYDINDALAEGTEVFSETEMVPRRVTDQSIIRRLIGRPESTRAFATRRNILDIAFQPASPGAKRTRKEQRWFEDFQARLKRRDA